MRTAHWMIYGATGYTGRLISREAVRRGHRPLLAGRSSQPLAELATQLDLDYLVLDLTSPRVLAKTLAPFRAVLLTAGPFLQTTRPVLEACLLSQTHYLDINAELPIIDYVLNQDQAAQRKGITLLPGTGFSVVASDCLAAYIAPQLNDPLSLDIAIANPSGASSGTHNSLLEILLAGGQVRRSGRLLNYPLGLDARHVRFADRSRRVLPIALGDLSTAYRSTGIPDITTYLALSPGVLHLARIFGRLGTAFLRWPRLRSWFVQRLGASGQGPLPAAQAAVRSQVYARAVGQNGNIAQAWLESIDAYHFSAISAVSCLEAVLQEPRSGAFTPAQILEADWVLQLASTRRLDRLPDRPSHPVT